ncbi:MAG: hypothetical protein HZA52_10105 [Planctomycetes bacterium]|nr:hypothetical protein [Planctomycetota bacterium]
MKSQLYPPLFALLVVTETGAERGAAREPEQLQGASHESSEPSGKPTEGAAAQDATERTEEHVRALLRAPNEPATPVATPERDKGGDGPLIITLVILLLVVVF